MIENTCSECTFFHLRPSRCCNQERACRACSWIEESRWRAITVTTAWRETPSPCWRLHSTSLGRAVRESENLSIYLRNGAGGRFQRIANFLVGLSLLRIRGIRSGKRMCSFLTTFKPRKVTDHCPPLWLAERDRMVSAVLQEAAMFNAGSICAARFPANAV